MNQPPRQWFRVAVIPLAVLLVILSGLAFPARPEPLWRERIWWFGLALTGLPVVWRTVQGLLRGHFAADVVAMLAIVTALLVGQPLPGLVVVLMQTGGEALERYAAGRASDAVRQLELAAPRIAHRIIDLVIEDIPVDKVRVDDRLLVRPGEMLPCDAVVVGGSSHVDASRLTGEPVPVRAELGARLMSGSLNEEGPLTVVATALASESQYARIVQLVRNAAASKSPLLRMADRYAVWFTPLTLGVCAIAFVFSRDSTRVLAVLVVATPCPLILAAPVAVVGGINRAAKRSVIIRNGEAIERLGQVTVAVFDKTGTLTAGRPSVSAVIARGNIGEDRLLGLAAAVEQGSGHLLARSVVDYAERRGLEVPRAVGITEAPGQGVIGRVGGQLVAVGARSFIASRFPESTADDRGDEDGHSVGLRAWIAVDGAIAGVIDYADQLRPGLKSFLDRLHRLGIRRTVLLTGDHLRNATEVARAVGIEEVRADLLPEDKVLAVAALEQSGARVVMIGDGTNDAPALRRATVGIALAAHGGGITAEAADVVILADDPSRVADAIEISRRTMAIARQSVWAGLGLSAVAMGVAAFGYIPPTIGALLQEGIDVAVILNALRASGDQVTGGGSEVRESSGYIGPVMQ